MDDDAPAPAHPQPAKFWPDPTYIRANFRRIKKSVATPPTLWLLTGAPAVIVGVGFVISRQPVPGWGVIALGVVFTLVGAALGAHPVWDSTRPAFIGVRSIRWRNPDHWVIKGFVFQTREGRLTDLDSVEAVALELHAEPDRWGHCSVIYPITPVLLEGRASDLPPLGIDDELICVPAMVQVVVTDKRSGATRAAGLLFDKIVPFGGSMWDAATWSQSEDIGNVIAIPYRWWNQNLAGAAARRLARSG